MANLKRCNSRFLSKGRLSTDFYKASHRNKLLAEAFYLTGDVEKYGTGFIRIRNMLTDEYKKMNLQVNSDSGAFWVTLSADGKMRTQKTAQKTAQKHCSDKKETTRDKIILLLKENPELTIKNLMQKLNKADGTIKEHLAKLKKEGLLKRVGSDRNGYWEVVQ